MNNAAPSSQEDSTDRSPTSDSTAAPSSRLESASSSDIALLGKMAAEPPIASRSKAVSVTGCPYETGLAFSRRRMAYSIGDSLLDRSKVMPKKFLSQADESKLSEDMHTLYTHILPSTESDSRRRQFVEKLDHMLNKRWPEANMKVHLFGSSGNFLCTNDSDVDICITTSSKELEKTCLIAAALVDSGMNRVVCIPQAKVPIIKFWDPDLQLACDLNINNAAALENTRMIRTYVEIDDRVRPLAMIIKHWTKQRILNDAALGGTLSSYAWICMILNFLQTRNPPILPSLHNKANEGSKASDAMSNQFQDDLNVLRGFGKENKETLGELLFHFFRRYAYDIDFERYVISVRQGRLISKAAKGWSLVLNNRLCVEEPFNTDRNLGNTADDTSFRGIHLELRRAFDLLALAKLDECMKPYEFPIAEEKVWEKPASRPLPVLTRSRSQSQSSRGKGGHVNRGGRQSNHSNYSKSRRASSSAATNKMNTPPLGQMGFMDRPPLLQGYIMQHQLDHRRLELQLLEEMQTLRQQELELRYKQAHNHLRELEIQASQHGQLYLAQAYSQDAMNRQMPFSIPLRSGSQFLPYHLPPSGSRKSSTHTQPSSPLIRPAVPDLRRSLHRSTPTGSMASSSIRSHSQPARGLVSQPGMTSGVPSFLPSHSQMPSHQGSTPPQKCPDISPSDPLYHMLETRGQYRPLDSLTKAEQQHLLAQQRPDDYARKEYAGYFIEDSSRHAYEQENARSIHKATLPDLNPMFTRLAQQGPDHSRHGSRSPSPTSSLRYRHRALSTQSVASTGTMSQNNRSQHPHAWMTRPLATAALAGINANAYIDYSSLSPYQLGTMNANDGSSLRRDVTNDLQPLSGPKSAFVGPFEETFAIDQARHLYQGLASANQHWALPTDRQEPPETTFSASEQVNVANVNGKLDVSEIGSPSINNLSMQHDGNESVRRNSITSRCSESRPPLVITSIVPDSLSLSGASSIRESPPIDSNSTLAPLLSPVREVRTPSPLGIRKDVAIGHEMRPVATKSQYGLQAIPTYAELVKRKQRAMETKFENLPDRSAAGKIEAVPRSSIGTITNKNYQSIPEPVASIASPSTAVTLGASSIRSERLGTSTKTTHDWQQTHTKRHQRNKSRKGDDVVKDTGEPIPTSLHARKGG